ncbi:methyl-accepting chemotaxis protein [Teredinibacter sp. KSP-S5-2]|uniref:HAMP domain-containing methyl-accepting chemotaxis protein n=1 Tax=Teredinibacter sp. KSP-S5-2 TaxID=3034506 RepID=UPI0029345832|nr:methyl-accepting chemotaxis protein [Teredinibacter sp. KSP-S5-2]WNO10662.1 methyl-accepting chemotaxis protein [Teredinibacter sp. KSP-S5-2]
MKLTVIQRISIGFLFLISFLVVIGYTGITSVNGINDNLQQVTTRAIPISEDSAQLSAQFAAVNLAMYQHYNSIKYDQLEESEKVFNQINSQYRPLLERLKSELSTIETASDQIAIVQTLQEKVPEVFSNIESTMRVYRMSFDGSNLLATLDEKVDKLEEQSQDILNQVRSVPVASPSNKQYIDDVAFHISQGIGLIKLISASKDNVSFRKYVAQYTEWMIAYLDKAYELQRIAENASPRVRSAIYQQNDLISEIIHLVASLEGYGNTKETYLGTKDTLFKNMVENEQALAEIRKDLHKVNEFASSYSKSVANNAQDSVSSNKLTIISISAVAIVIGVLVGLLLTSSIRTGLYRMMNALQRMATGDLTEKLRQASDDEFGKLQKSASTLSQYLRDMIHAIQDQSHAILESIEDTQNITQSTKSAITGQKNEIDMVATAMQEMTATIREVSSIAQETFGEVLQAHDYATNGEKNIEDNKSLTLALKSDMDIAAKVIEQLDSDVRKIEEILLVIDAIAQQTNLLALNAAIEAARAGEHGRGFSVVADEVRTLASRTQESTEEIKHNIETLLQSSERAVSSINQSQIKTDQSVEKAQSISEQIRNIVTIMARIKDMNMQIATASEQQSTVTEEVTKNITRISELAENTEQGAQKNEENMIELLDSSKTLEKIVEKFKTN